MKAKVIPLFIVTSLIVMAIGVSLARLVSNESVPQFLIPEANFQSVDGHVCFGLNQKELWNFGDQGDELQKHLTENMQIIIDSQQMDRHQIAFFNTALLLFVNDQNGNVIGSYGTPVRTCFPTNGLAKGMHYAEIQIKDRKEKSYKYAWTLNIN